MRSPVGKVSGMGRKVILDVDTGTDDAVAIMFAALHPELDLLGVTTVNGNVALGNTTDNTLRVLDWIGCPDIPVHPGVPHPIARFGFPGGRHFEQDDEHAPHGTALPIPEPSTAARDTGATEYLVETLRATAEPITLVAVGPLSNIATALAVDPSVAVAVDELVVMGGGHAVTNVSASAEFNIWADPEAASVVLSAGFDRRTLVTLDATHRALIPQRTCDALDALGTPAGTAARFITRRIGAYEDTTAGAAPVHDGGVHRLPRRTRGDLHPAPARRGGDREPAHRGPDRQRHAPRHGADAERARRARRGRGPAQRTPPDHLRPRPHLLTPRAPNR